MTATLRYHEPPAPLTARHAQQGPGQTIAKALIGAVTTAARNVDRPWSIGVDALVLAAFFGLLCWEGWEFGVDGEWEHLAAACACLVAGTVYAFRAFTADRSENDR